MLGESILSHWQFPRSITDIPQNYLNPSRHMSSIDLCDLVTIANNKICTKELRLPWSDIISIQRLGWHSSTVDEEFETLAPQIELAHDIFEC